MQKMFKLTIAVLTYNRANYLKEMLDSILQQTYKDFHVVIYDNCSEDNTSEKVKEYLSDKRFSYHRHIINIGSENGNFALRNCNTEYLLITHDDDYMHPDLIKEEIAIIEANKDISIVWTNMNLIDINRNIINTSTFSEKMNNQDCIINYREYIEVLVRKNNIVTCPTVMFRMSIIHASNLEFRADIGGACDCYLWLELNQLNYRFYYINKALYYYRIHSGQDRNRTLSLNPKLKKPVYNLLLKNNYSRKTIKSWLNWVNHSILIEICKQQNMKNSINVLKDHIFLVNELEFLFKINLFLLMISPSFIKNLIPKPIKKLIKTFLR